MVGGLESTVIELKGSSCDELVNRAYAHEVYDNGNRELDPNDLEFARWVWANLFRVIAKYPHKGTRFDVPVDDFTGVIPLEELKRKCLAKEYVSRMRVPSIEREISVDDDEAVEDYAKERKCNKGWSFTLGRRTSPSQLCIYDKKAETEGVGVVMAPQWVRFESRFYGDRPKNSSPSSPRPIEARTRSARRNSSSGACRASSNSRRRGFLKTTPTKRTPGSHGRNSSP